MYHNENTFARSQFESCTSDCVASKRELLGALLRACHNAEEEVVRVTPSLSNTQPAEWSNSAPFVVSRIWYRRNIRTTPVLTNPIPHFEEKSPWWPAPFFCQNGKSPIAGADVHHCCYWFCFDLHFSEPVSEVAFDRSFMFCTSLSCPRCPFSGVGTHLRPSGSHTTAICVPWTPFGYTHKECKLKFMLVSTCVGQV